MYTVCLKPIGPLLWIDEYLLKLCKLESGRSDTDDEILPFVADMEVAALAVAEEDSEEPGSPEFQYSDVQPMFLMGV